MNIRPRRSVLFMPGSNPRALEKARGLACDAVALDLEDAVGPPEKAAARQAVCAAVRARAFGPREVLVRINSLATPEGADDLAAVAGAGADAVILSKVGAARDVAQARAGLPPSIAIWAMIETPAAILNLREIAQSGASVLVLGSNDLMKEMGARPMPDRQNLWAAMGLIVLAARAQGLGVIDGTYNDIGNAAGLAADCEQGRAFGFDGKTLIHPAQIETANRIFAPSPAEIEAARQIVAAFALPANRDKGAIRHDGRMIERLHAEEALRLLALADAIAARA